MIEKKGKARGFMSQQEYVWYASYGSNINRDRFLCYIQGGNPKGSTKVERGCRDKTLPKADRLYVIHHPLYFAKEAGQWQGGGVCFIGLEHSESCNTLSYMYLLTREQFLDVVSQENNNGHFDFDLQEIIENGAKSFRQSWYGNILYLGTEEGYPVFTFTSNEDVGSHVIRKPSENYLKTIMLGMKREIGLNPAQIVDYFSQVPGTKDEFSREELLKLALEA